MERAEVIDAMKQLRIYGMRTAYDEIITTAVKRQHEPQQIIGDLAQMMAHDGGNNFADAITALRGTAPSMAQARKVAEALARSAL